MAYSSSLRKITGAIDRTQLKAAARLRMYSTRELLSRISTTFSRSIGGERLSCQRSKALKADFRPSFLDISCKTASAKAACERSAADMAGSSARTSFRLSCTVTTPTHEKFASQGYYLRQQLMGVNDRIAPYRAVVARIAVFFINVGLAIGAWAIVIGAVDFVMAQHG